MELNWKIFIKGKIRNLFLLLVGMLLTALNGIFIPMVIIEAQKITVETTIRAVVNLGLLSLGIWVLVLWGGYLLSYAKENVIENINLYLKESILQSINSRKNKFDDTAILTSYTTNIKLFEKNFLEPHIDIFTNMVIAFVAVIFMIQLDPLISTVFILSSLLVFIPQLLAKKYLIKSGQKMEKAQSSELKYFNDFIGGLGTLRNYQVDQAFTQKVSNAAQATEKSYREMKLKAQVVTFISQIVIVTSFILPFFLGVIVGILNNRLDIATLIAIFLATDKVQAPLFFMIQSLNQIKASEAIKEDLERYLLDETKTIDPVILEKNREIEAVTFKNVSLDFDSKTILNNASFTINKGDKVLITGPSGSGKSTMLNLILGSLYPKSGEIRFETENQQLSNQVMQEQIAMIYQKAFIFSDTLKFNVDLGQGYSDEQILSVLEKVNLRQELGQEALVYDCGEQGSKLSEGQKQRLEIARALLSEKKVILLDEVTASLDEENAQMIRALIYQLPATIIEVAHHFDLQEMKQAGFRHFQLQAGQVIE